MNIKLKDLRDASAGDRIETLDDRIVYTRVLGHAEILNSHKWRESTDCWYCQKWKYTIIIVSASIFKHFFIKSFQIDKG